MLWLALFLLLFSVETCECGCIVGQVLVRDEHHTRMFHAVYLFGGETIHLSELAQVVNIRLVCTVLCCNLARHGAVVARKHNAVLADNDWCLQSSAVVAVCHIPNNALRVFVTLVVAVIHALTILINRETFSRLVGIVHVMAGCGCSCLSEDVVTTDCRTICKGDSIRIALKLGCSVPLCFYLRVHGMSADGLLLGCFLSGNALVFLQTCNGFGV